MKNVLKKIYKKSALVIYGIISRASEKGLMWSTGKLYKATWFFDAPDYFDHKFDLNYKWENENSVYFIDRGVLNTLAISRFDSPKVLEFCCGDGFFSRMFYRNLSDSVEAYDYCKEAIENAKKRYARDGLTFGVLDVNQLDEMNYISEGITNVIFDAAIEYFTPEQTDVLLKKIKAILATKNGILSGTCPQSKMIETKNTYQNFASAGELESFLVQYFNCVKVVEIKYKDRVNMHFYASDGEIGI